MFYSTTKQFAKILNISTDEIEKLQCPDYISIYSKLNEEVI